VTSQAQAEDKARVLVEALPYIRTYRGQTVVVKIGGAALEDPEHASIVADDLALMSLVGIRIVVVHGGGPQVSAAMKQAGFEARFVGGLRVTEPEAMSIVRAVLVGSINPDLVARLSSSGLRAVGLSGIDDSILSATKTAGPQGEDIGWVGQIESVNGELLMTLLDSGYTPVLASVGYDGEHPLNINADEVVGAVAASVNATKLVYLTNVEGLYKDFGDKGSLVSELKADELDRMLPSLSEGMQPKARSALFALRQGVGKVHILDGRIPHALLLEVFTDRGIGTQVLP
jgi:acetylglutamate kinase